MSGYLNKNEIMGFFSAATLISRQLKMDSKEIVPTAFVVFSQKVDLDGDFGSSENKIDEQTLMDTLDWIRTQLQWKNEDLQSVKKKNGEWYIECKNSTQLLKFLDAHEKNSNKIDLAPNTKLDKTQFYTIDTNERSNLSHKGIAVIQNYFEEKDKNRNDTFIVNTEADLKKAFDLLKQANDGASCVLIYRAGNTHWVPLKCEKKNGEYYIAEMDSLGVQKDYKVKNEQLMVVNAVINTFQNNEKVFISRAKNQRQYSPNNCAFFSIKDARKMQNDVGFMDKVDDHKLTPFKKITSRTNGNIQYREYLTPLDYMKTVQSSAAIGQFVKNYNDNNIKQDNRHVPITEAKVQEISFLKNRKLDRLPRTNDSKAQNKTVAYFKDKYMQDVVDKKIKNSSTNELQRIINNCDINKMTVERLNQTVTQPRNLSKITPDPEKIELITLTDGQKAELQNLRKDAKTSLDTAKRNAQIRAETGQNSLIKHENKKADRLMTSKFSEQTKKMNEMRKEAQQRKQQKQQKGTAALGKPAASNDSALIENTQSQKVESKLADSDNLNVKWEKMAAALDKVQLDSSAGHITNNALRALKSVIANNKNLAKDNDETQKARMEKLIAQAEKIQINNIKNGELKQLITQIKQIQLPEKKALVIRKSPPRRP